MRWPMANSMSSAREIEAHFAACARCAATFAEAMSLKQKLGMLGLHLRAPARLVHRIAQALPTSPPKEVARAPGAALAPAPFRELRKAWALRVQGALAGAGGAFALAACLAFLVMRAGSGEEIAANLIDGHLRSLAGEHLFDVQSTDQHTVKPWFAGRLAVTPPVPDLDLKGFTLVGGRLDYVRGQAAAVVVYRSPRPCDQPVRLAGHRPCPAIDRAIRLFPASLD
jgi:anti-sigma factor RsiW